jgi:hypothetical protein
MRDDAIILACIPHRIAEHELSDDGRVSVLQPRFSWAPLQRLMMRWNRPFIRVKLDATGSLLWLQCDGERTVGTIASACRASLGDQLADSDPRVVEFFRSLVKSGLVRLQRP